ncbi:MAG: HYR domain-containing protein [Marinilabiliaceae bacterium]|nr:HYR domain-containing protein [Marinilabiliaceae bacterium]
MNQLRLLLIVTTIAFTSLEAWSNGSQGNYRWRNDDGTESSASWKADENTPITIDTIGNIRLRVAVNCVNSYNDESFNNTINISYSVNNGTTYAMVSSDTSEAFVISLSDSLFDLEATTDQLTGGVFMGGVVQEESYQHFVSIPKDSEFEMEYCIIPTKHILPDTTYLFRISVNGINPLSVYNSTIKLHTASDLFAPEISDMPADIITVNDSGQNYATVSWTTPTASDDVGVESFTSNYAPGNQFPIGTTTVTYTAADAYGRSTTSNFTVTVTDDEKPDINGLPDNIIVNNDEGQSYATVSWAMPTAIDNVGVDSIGSDYVSGCQFPIGTTTVTYTASDTSGNSTSASFTITVNNLTSISNTKSKIITVSPNPSENFITLSGINETSKVSIITMNGLEIISKTIEANESISIEHLQKGFYSIIVTFKDFTFKSKLIKK